MKNCFLPHPEPFAEGEGIASFNMRAVFGSSYEALIRVMGDKLDADFATKLKAQGVDIKAINPAYPYETWVESLELAMAVLWPGASKDEATYRMGRAMFDSWGHTLMGRALLPLLRLLGPKRGIERMTRNFRSSNNYAETKVTARGPTEYELWLNLVAFPHYYRGLLEAGLVASGAKDAKVEVVSHAPTGEAVLLLSWKP